MADWERALDKQLATYLWWHTPVAEQVAEGWAEDVNSKYTRSETARGIVRQQRQLLWQADPIWITEDMADLLEAAWPQFEPELVRQDDLIIPAGFALLPRVLYVTDLWGKRTPVRAIAWMQAADDEGPGIFVTLYCGATDADDYGTEKLPFMSRLYGDAMSMSHTTALRFGTDPAQLAKNAYEARTDKDRISEEQAWQASFQQLRLLQCFWRLTKQQIAVGFRRQPSRATRRRSERAEYPDKYVTVVTLRRPRSDSAEPEHHAVDWKMRWIVSGHWRWQPYKDGSRRQIWIAPYVKGPEDKPLAVRKLRVFQWSR